MNGLAERHGTADTETLVSSCSLWVFCIEWMSEDALWIWWVVTGEIGMRLWSDWPRRLALAAWAPNQQEPRRSQPSGQGNTQQFQIL